MLQSRWAHWMLDHVIHQHLEGKPYPWFAFQPPHCMLHLMISWILYGSSLSKWLTFQISLTYYSISKMIQYTLSASINNVSGCGSSHASSRSLNRILVLPCLVFGFFKKDVKSESCYNSDLRHQMTLRDKSEACVEIMRQLHGKRVYAANVRMLIIPSDSFVYFQIPSFVWFGIGAMFVLALAKGEITWDVIKKMDTALFWREQWSPLYESMTVTTVIRAMQNHKSLFELFSHQHFHRKKRLIQKMDFSYTSFDIVFLICVISIAYVCVCVCVHMWNYLAPGCEGGENLTLDPEINAKWTTVRQFTRQSIMF